MNLQPLFDRVIIRRDENTEQQTAGGLYIPDAAQQKATFGEVLAVGTGNPDLVDSYKRILKVGDRVFFGKYAGIEAEFDGQVYLIMREEEILAVIKQ